MFCKPRAVRLLPLTVAALWCAPFVLGQQAAESPPAAPQQQPEPSPEQRIAAMRAELRKELSAAKRVLEDASAGPDAKPPDHLTKEVGLLERIDVYFTQQEAQLKRAEELRAAKKQLETELDTLRRSGPTEDRPDSFLLLESVRGELGGHNDRLATITAAAQAKRKSWEDAELAYEERAAARRQAREALKTNTEDSAAAGLAIAFRLAELESRVADEALRLRESEHQDQLIAGESYQLRLTYLTEKLAWIEARARFAERDRDEQLDKVARAESQVQRRLRSANYELDAAAQRLTNIRQRRDSAVQTDQALVEAVEAARLAREARQLEVTLLGERLERLALVRRLWMRRYATINAQASRAARREWQEESTGELEWLNRSTRLHADEAAELRKSLVTLRQKLESAKDTELEAARWIREQIQPVREQVNLYEAEIADIETARRLCEKLLAEIGSETQTLNVAERLGAFWDAVLAIWRYELAAVDDRPITVSKIVIGVILLVVGTLLARGLSRLLGRRLLRRLGFDAGAAAAIQSLVFYLLLLSLALLALRIVNVPLTAFTVVGGAIAIGVGFGSQNVMNNFISGLILLVERPIRVGDLIQLEELLVTVEHIGPRSTRVRSPDNVDLIVPNSSFLEKNVVNWTLSDDRYRTSISIGVAYGAATRDVSRLLRQAVKEHGKILKKPDPIVLFTDFGDNALQFEIHFWIRMKRLMDRRIIESDIRYRIDNLFREAGIVIAFPQRDVHVDSAKPLHVHLVSDAATAATDAKPAD